MPYRKKPVEHPPLPRYDVSFKKLDPASGKTFFVKIGVGFPTDSGRIKVRLDALPLTIRDFWDGDLWLFPHTAATTSPVSPPHDTDDA